jgi:hypothetical protein
MSPFRPDGVSVGQMLVMPAIGSAIIRLVRKTRSTPGRHSSVSCMYAVLTPGGMKSDMPVSRSRLNQTVQLGRVNGQPTPGKAMGASGVRPA